jgi:methyl-accepting chemotaxis protein
MISLLRKCTLTVRMIILFLLFVSVLLIVNLINNATMSEVKIKGDLYLQIVQGKDLVADILPPPEYIIESYLTTLQLMNEADDNSRDELIQYGDKLKKDYLDRHDYWVKALDQSDMKTALVDKSYEYAMQFYSTRDNEFIPAVLAKDQAAMDKAYVKMKQAYDLHRAEIDKVVAASNDLNTKTEKDADARISTGDRSSLLTIVCALLMLAALSYIITRSISKPIKQLVMASSQLALGNINVQVDSGSRDEMGQLADAFTKMIMGIREQTKSSQNIADGDVFAQIHLHSSDDILSHSLESIAKALQQYYKDMIMLVDSIRKGDFSVRGDETQYHGYFATLMAGTNELLGLVENDVINNKKHAAALVKLEMYQKNESQKIVLNLERLARGELVCDIQVAPGDDETGELNELYSGISHNMHSSVDTIKSYIDEISYSLGELAKGNLTVNMTKEYLGEFAGLRNSIIAITKSLNEILLEIHTSADQVATGTSQVSDGAQALSQGATEQASAIEQLTVSIGQIAGQTKQNAINAGQASGLAATAMDNALTGNRHMQDMLTSMQDINEASANISKIIKVIDDIAFQTNLLALNAAVEAARAGQYGKGFAVVAEEVRSLAARSANAAKETTELIEGTVRKVDAGTKTARETAAALGSIISGIQQTTELVKGIASASNEQATAVEQISRGIDQVAQVVQTTSATAEESAATSEELSGQAEYLKEMVDQFTLQGSLRSAPGLPKAVAAGKPDKPRIMLNGNGVQRK